MATGDLKTLAASLSQRGKRFMVGQIVCGWITAEG
jgi:hypothetical protein